MTAIIKPTVNLNGTSARELLQLQLDAAHALSAAIAAVQAAAPNGRDYQTSRNPHAHTRALEEHTRRLVKLQEVQAEIREIGEHVSDSL